MGVCCVEKTEAFWVDIQQNIFVSQAQGNRGDTVQLLSRGRDALAVVTNNRGGACPGAVDQ